MEHLAATPPHAVRRRPGLGAFALAGLSCVTTVTDVYVSHRVSTGPAGSYEASLATFDDVDEGLVVVWYDHRDGNAEIYARRLDERGRPSGPERRLTESRDRSYEPDVVAIDQDLLVAWYEAPTDGPSRAMLGRWSPEGDPRWSLALSGTERGGRNPLVRVVSSRVFCAWLEGDGTDRAVWSRWFDFEGQPVTAAVLLAPAGPSTWNVNAAVAADGVVWVVFDATAGTRSDELFLVEVAGPNPTPRSQPVRLTDDDGVPSKYPDVAVQDQHVGLTWFDERDGNREVYLAVGARRAIVADVERLATRVTTTSGESIGAYLAWNGDHLGLAWSDEGEDRGQHDVYSQVFYRDGTPRRGARRLTDNPTASLIPAIRPWRDGFALAWNEDVIDMRGDHETGGRSEIRFALVD